MFSNKTYTVLKWIALVILPAIAGMYLGLANVWNLPEPQNVAGVIMAFDAFLGVLLAVAIAKYDEQVGPVVQFLDPATFDNIMSWTMSKQTYDMLKDVAQVFMPGVATLYFTLAPALGLPFADQIIATIAVLDAFLGIVLQFNNSQYKLAVEASATVRAMSINLTPAQKVR